MKSDRAETFFPDEVLISYQGVPEGLLRGGFTNRQADVIFALMANTTGHTLQVPVHTVGAPDIPDGSVRRVLRELQALGLRKTETGWDLSAWKSPRFLKVPAELLTRYRELGLTGNQFTTLLLMALDWRPDNRTPFMSGERLATLLRVSLRTAQRLLSELQKHPFIWVRVRGSRWNRRANEYDLVVFRTEAIHLVRMRLCSNELDAAKRWVTHNLPWLVDAVAKRLGDAFLVEHDGLLLIPDLGAEVSKRAALTLAPYLGKWSEEDTAAWLPAKIAEELESNYWAFHYQALVRRGENWVVPSPAPVEQQESWADFMTKFEASFNALVPIQASPG
ncbi:MAG: hypothetical protein JNK82_33455 [Myxococcaceae bacterium]|nr:hypothetical protein [Myxococcaceae bacterium]